MFRPLPDRQPFPRWPRARLEDVVLFRSGHRDSDTAVSDGDFPFFVCSKKVLRSNEFDFDDEAVIMAGNNADGVFHLHHFNGKFAARQRTYVITPKTKQLDCRWLFLQLGVLQPSFQAAAIGTTTRYVTIEMLRKAEIALPGLEIQRAISEITTDLDGLIGVLEKLIAKKQDLKQAAMQQLLTGQTRLPGFHGEWEVKPLGSEIADLEAGVSVNSVEDDPESDSGRPAVLKTSAVANGRFIPSESKSIAPRDLRRMKLSPRADSVIISRMNTIDLVGECGYVPADFPRLFVPDRLWMTRFKASSRVSAKWLAFVLSTPVSRRLLKNIATGTSGSMKNISKGTFLALEFAFPGPDEQTAVAAVLTDMETELSGLQRRLAKTLDVKRAMMQELLTEKISLVSQETSHA
jgi:restriction endonuclease S subunit